MENDQLVAEENDIFVEDELVEIEGNAIGHPFKEELKSRKFDYNM